MSINSERGGVYDPGFYTGPEWAITQTKEGGTNPALSQGKMALLTHGRDAAILGGKVGSLFDYSSADPAQKAALEKELQRRHDIEAATRQRKVQQSITKVLAAAAVGGAIAAAGGAAAAGGSAAVAPAAAPAAVAPAATTAGFIPGSITTSLSGTVPIASGTGLGLNTAVGMGGAFGTGGAGLYGGLATAGTVAGAAPSAASSATPALTSSTAPASGGFGWKDAAKVGLDAYSGYKQAEEAKKAAAAAAKGKSATTMRTPFYNEAISLLIPYILTNLQNIFQSRMQTYGGSAAPFDIYRQLLSGVPQNYSGVGAPGNPILGR